MITTVRLVQIAQRQWPWFFEKCLLKSIDPSGQFFYYWTIVIVLVFVFNLITCPMFVFEEFGDSYYHHWIIANLLTDVLNIGDLFVQAKRGSFIFLYQINPSLVFYKNGVLINKPLETARHYTQK
jgi:hypothetical protein